MIANVAFSYAYWAFSIDTSNASASGNISIGMWDIPNEISIFTDFEDVSKGTYATGNITTYNNTWLFNDALIGSLSSDLKNDAQSARLRSGTMETLFSIINLTSVDFYAGRFGSDALGTFTIELSSDGIVYEIYDTITVTTNLMMYTIYFEESQANILGLSLNDALYLRFQSTDSHRINIDDVDIKYAYDPNEVLSFSEHFENATKTAYAQATISINGLDWLLNDTLIGTLSQDQKNGTRSVRLRNGYIQTEFRIAHINKIAFYVGNYNTQSQSAQLYIEVSNDGITWYTLLSNYTTTSSFIYYELAIDNAILNPFGLYTSDALYIRIGSTNNQRVNIDDFEVEYFGALSFNV